MLIKYRKTCGCCDGYAEFDNEEEVEDAFESMGLTTAGNYGEIESCDTFYSYEIIED